MAGWPKAHKPYWVKLPHHQEFNSHDARQLQSLGARRPFAVPYAPAFACSIAASKRGALEGSKAR